MGGVLSTGKKVAYQSAKTSEVVQQNWKLDFLSGEAGSQGEGQKAAKSQRELRLRWIKNLDIYELLCYNIGNKMSTASYEVA